MKTRIKEKNGKFYPQVKTGLFKWSQIGRWWGNLGTVIIDGVPCVMHRDCRMSTTCFEIGYTKEEANEFIDALNKQGYLYAPEGISPDFKDGYIHFNTHLN